MKKNIKVFFYDLNIVETKIRGKIMSELIITSPAFQNNGPMPKKYTCDGEDINPPLRIEKMPEGSRSLVIIFDDPDAPMGTWSIG